VRSAAELWVAVIEAVRDHRPRLRIIRIRLRDRLRRARALAATAPLVLLVRLAIRELGAAQHLPALGVWQSVLAGDRIARVILTPLLQVAAQLPLALHERERPVRALQASHPAPTVLQPLELRGVGIVGVLDLDPVALLVADLAVQADAAEHPRVEASAVVDLAQHVVVAPCLLLPPGECAARVLVFPAGAWRGRGDDGAAAAPREPLAPRHLLLLSLGQAGVRIP